MIVLKILNDYSYSEELANALTHGIGAVLFLVLSPLIISFAVQTSFNRKIIGSVLFSFGLLSVYFSSTIFHAIPDKFTKDVLNYFDLISIYFLIAGTYAPILLIYFRDRTGTIYHCAVWVLALAGVIFEVFFHHLPFYYSLVIYIALGWIGIFMIRPAMKKVQSKVLWLILLGGIFYTIGTYFFSYDMKYKYYHAIWHCFVLVGSICHYIAVLVAIKDKVRSNVNVLER